MKKYLIDDNDNNIKLPQIDSFKSNIIRGNIIINGQSIPIIITGVSFEMNNSIYDYETKGLSGLSACSNEKLVITGEIDIIYSKYINACSK